MDAGALLNSLALSVSLWLPSTRGGVPHPSLRPNPYSPRSPTDGRISPVLPNGRISPAIPNGPRDVSVHALPVDDVAALLEDLSDLGDGADWLSESVTRARLLSFGGDLSEDDSSEEEDEAPKLDPRIGARLASKARSRKRTGSGLGVRVGESDYSSDEDEEEQGAVGQRCCPMDVS